MIKDALDWYCEIAEAAKRYSDKKDGVALSALIIELSLDAGKRAKKAFEELNHLKTIEYHWMSLHKTDD